jgi:hypothetical protein
MKNKLMKGFDVAEWKLKVFVKEMRRKCQLAFGTIRFIKKSSLIADSGADQCAYGQCKLKSETKLMLTFCSFFGAELLGR